MPEEIQCQEEAQGRLTPILVSTCPGGPHTEVGPGDKKEGESPKSMPAYKSRSEGLQTPWLLRGSELCLGAGLATSAS